MKQLTRELIQSGYSPEFIRTWVDKIISKTKTLYDREAAVQYLGEVVAENVLSGGKRSRRAFVHIDSMGFEKGPKHMQARKMLDREIRGSQATKTTNYTLLGGRI